MSLKTINKKRNWPQIISWSVMSIVIGWLLFTFLIYPNINMLSITLFPDNTFDFEPVIRIFRSERVRQSLWNSFLIGVTVAISTNIIGLFQVFILDYFEIKGRKWLNLIYYTPLVINGMVLVLGYNFIIGTNGIVTTWIQSIFPSLPNDWMIGFWAVFLQLTFSNTIYHMTVVRDSLHNLDYQTVEAAKNMGGSTWSILRKVVLPTLTPSILAATILNFSMAMGSFASPKILGGDNFETINPLVLSFSQSNTTKNYAVILSVFLAVITIIILAIFTWYEKRQNIISVSKVKTPIKRQKINNSFVNIVVTSMAYIIALLQLIPAILVIIFSFMDYQDLLDGNLNPLNWNIENYGRVFTSLDSFQPILISLVYAGLAAVISVAIILVFAYWITRFNNKITNLLESVLMIPWFLPSTLIALGILYTFNTSRALVFDQILTGTVWIVVVGYIIMRLPSNLRILKTGYQSIDSSLEDASKNLGASSISTFFKVLLPIILPTALSTALLAFIGLLAEFDLTVFLFQPLYQPLGVSINNATAPEAAPDAVMLSFVYAVIIMIIASLATYFVYGRRNKES